MPKGSKALSRARETEIIDACAELYETMGFRDITILQKRSAPRWKSAAVCSSSCL